MRAVLLGILLAVQAPAGPPPAPAVYLSEASLMATLKEAEKTAPAPAMHTAPVKLAEHYRINIVRRRSGRAADLSRGAIRCAEVASPRR